jgi:hypothetical protein
MHLNRALALAGALLLAGCTGQDDANVDQGGAAAVEADNEFQVEGKIDRDMQLDVDLKAGKVAVVSLMVRSTDPVSVVVKAADGDVDLQLFGLLDKNGKFGTLRAESRLIPKLGAHVFGFTPDAADVGGLYAALVSEKSGRAVPFTLEYGAAKSADFRFTVNANLRGEENKDPAAARASFDATCETWKTNMLRLSLASVELLDCGSPRQSFEGTPFESQAKMVIAAKGAPNAAPQRVDGAAITANSVDGWLNACNDALLEAQKANGARFLAGTCGQFNAIDLTVVGVHTETITSTTQILLAP